MDVKNAVLTQERTGRAGIHIRLHIITILILNKIEQDRQDRLRRQDKIIINF